MIFDGYLVPTKCHIMFFLKLQYVLHQGESMVKHTKKVDEKISSFKISNFSQKHKKIDSNFT